MDIGRRIVMTVLGARFLGARSSFEAREYRDPGFCVLEGHGKVAAVTCWCPLEGRRATAYLEVAWRRSL